MVKSSDLSSGRIVTPAAGGTRRRTGRWRPLLGRAISAFAAGFLLWVTWQWWQRALELNTPCGSHQLSLAVCEEVPEVLQGLQLAVALLGIALAIPIAVLSLMQAVRNKPIPGLPFLSWCLLGVLLTWFGIYLLGLAF